MVTAAARNASSGLLAKPRLGATVRRKQEGLMLNRLTPVQRTAAYAFVAGVLTVIVFVLLFT